MYKLETGKKRRSKKTFWGLFLLSFLTVAAVVTTFSVRYFYMEALKPRSSVNETIAVTIDPGATSPQIAKILVDKGIIRAAWAFEWYTRLTGANNKLKAGTYNLSPALPVQDIVGLIIDGKVATDSVTILPGKTLDDIKAVFRDSGYSDQDIDSALDVKNYQDHPVVAYLPDGADLEGFLHPETFQKTAETSAETIIRQSLDELDNIITQDVIDGLKARNLTVYQGIILASIVEKESAHPEDRTKVAQVYLKRLAIGMRLEADPTAQYGAKKVGLSDLSNSSDTPYNTYKIDGLPPGPISTISTDSLMAVVNPAATDYLFFVANDIEENGGTVFSYTLAEHEANALKYCKKSCGRP